MHDNPPVTYGTASTSTQLPADILGTESDTDRRGSTKGTSMSIGYTVPSGSLGLSVARNPDRFAPGYALSDLEILEATMPRSELPDEVNDWRSDNRPKVLADLQELGYARSVARQYGLPHLWSQLWLRKRTVAGEWLSFGFAGIKVVTDAGVAFIVDAFQNTEELENMKYHALGTNNIDEDASDTAMAAEITTQYETDNTRPTGTTTEGASANIYRTVGTNTVDDTVAAVEHGIFDQAANSGGTLLDRTVFSVINLSSGDSLESTYELTFASGS